MSDGKETKDSNHETLSDECLGHPLFPRPEGETGPETRRIGRILIERYPSLESTQKELCPRAFLPHELRSWDDVIDLYGGGVYLLRAQDSKSYCFQGTTEKTFFSSPPPRPFREAPAAVVPALATAGTTAAVPLPSTATPGAPSPVYGASPVPSPTMATGNGLDLMALLVAMLNKPAPTTPDLAPLVAALNKPAAPAPDMTPLLATVLKSSADAQIVLMRAMIESRAAQTPAQNPLELLRELKPLLGNGGDTAKTLLEGVEIARGLYQSASTGSAPAAPPPEDDIGQTLGAIFKLVGQSQQQQPSVPAPAPAAAPPPIPSPLPPAWAWARRPDGAMVPVAIGAAPAVFGSPPSLAAAPMAFPPSYGGAPPVAMEAPPRPVQGPQGPSSAPMAAMPAQGSAPPAVVAGASAVAGPLGETERYLIHAFCSNPALRTQIKTLLERTEPSSPAVAPMPPLAAPSRPHLTAVSPVHPEPAAATPTPPVRSATASPETPNQGSPSASSEPETWSSPAAAPEAVLASDAPFEALAEVATTAEAITNSREPPEPRNLRVGSDHELEPGHTALTSGISLSVLASPDFMETIMRDLDPKAAALLANLLPRGGRV